MAASSRGHRQAKTTRTPPGLAIFLAALRWQESGSPQGNYTEANGQGAYQIIQSNWPTWARQYAGYNTTDPNASHAPKAVQDKVAAAKVTDYYYGSGERNWRLVARIWNGGSPNPVPNPALGPGATTDDYASSVLRKVGALDKSGYKGGPIDLDTAVAGGVYLHGETDVGCKHNLKIPLRFAPDFNLCMDKPLAILSFAAGGFLIFTGVAVILASALERTKAAQTASSVAGLTPAGLAVRAAAAQGQRANAKAAERRSSQATAERERDQRTARDVSARRGSDAERRREETHRNTQARAAASHKAAEARKRTAARYDNQYRRARVQGQQNRNNSSLRDPRTGRRRTVPHGARPPAKYDPVNDPAPF